MKEFFYRIISGKERGARAKVFIFLFLGLSILYGLGVRCVRFFYKIGFFPKSKLPVVVISVGNLTWGGVGKTPFVQWLVRYCKGLGLKPAILIRGYSLPQKSSSMEIPSSDEARLLARTFADVPILVGKNRFQTAQQFLQNNKVDVFIMDDGFQHWRLARDLDIVLIDATNPWGQGHLIPRGMLREPLSSLARADVIVLTKTDRGTNHLAAIKEKLRRVCPQAPISETIHHPTALKNVLAGTTESLSILNGRKIGAFCGIAEPNSFFEHLRSLNADVIYQRAFLDHYAYEARDIESLLTACLERNVSSLVTTEKDAVKLQPYLNLFRSRKCQLFILSIEIQFTVGQKECCERISCLFNR